VPTPYDAPVTAAPPESRHAPTVVRATLNARFVGRSIDIGIVWGLALLGFYAAPFLIGDDPAQRRELLWIALAAALMLALLWSTFQWVSLANTGQTLGRRVARVRIVDLNAASPGFVQGVLLREWSFWFPGIVILLVAFFFPLGAASPGTGPSTLPGVFWEYPVAFLAAAAGLRAADFAFAVLPGGRCLHDRLAKTRAIFWDARARRVYERSRLHGSAT
jgi:uncharacterized RDD family membrane protein YckC